MARKIEILRDVWLCLGQNGGGQRGETVRKRKRRGERADGERERGREPRPVQRLVSTFS